MSALVKLGGLYVQRLRVRRNRSRGAGYGEDVVADGRRRLLIQQGVDLDSDRLDVGRLEHTPVVAIKGVDF